MIRRSRYSRTIPQGPVIPDQILTSITKIRVIWAGVPGSSMENIEIPLHPCQS